MRSPHDSTSEGSTFNCALPYRSTHSTSATNTPDSSREIGMRPGTSVGGSMRSPSSSRSAPAHRCAAGEEKAGGAHVVRLDVMREIDHIYRRRDRPNHRLHDADELVDEPVVRQECDRVVAQRR